MKQLNFLDEMIIDNFAGGGGASRVICDPVKNPNGSFQYMSYCRCYYCDTTSGYHFGSTEEESKRAAIEAWNKRKPMERIVEQLEEKKKEHEDILHYENRMSMFAREELFRKIGLIKRCINIVKEEGGME